MDWKFSIKAYLRAFTHGTKFVTTQLEGEMVEPYIRRLVLRSVAHIIRLYSSSLITECEVQYAQLYLFPVSLCAIDCKGFRVYETLPPVD